ncbi:MAG TPA: ribonuclease III [Rhodocyclaceae bacterium]|nr:ribonuclease III [Rhodocyclaceae bacterium]HMV53985.1 ribonuclease III [Rhodocyclaceae bacterium]HNB79043.1 ribonuclease III [Rhodocyclaceae bacterium]HNH13853.1 ribonuclease III [Rhodocyclaceae bacterium]HNH99662.1 ribonuclease III [Rhodocyclaceae bacterium]
MGDLRALQGRLNHRFGRIDLLEQALTHRSAGAANNERLEFLGDSILNCVIAIALCERFGTMREGELSRLRANLVRQDTLYKVALGLDLGPNLRLGEGELRSGGVGRPSILGDALEAVFGAIFLDAGFDRVKDVILGLYRNHLERIDPRVSGKDAKTRLQEWLQGRRLPLPAYDLMAVQGEAHAQEFQVACRVGKPPTSAIGRGPNRRAAEQDAAHQVLEQLNDE